MQGYHNAAPAITTANTLLSVFPFQSYFRLGKTAGARFSQAG